MHQIKNKKYFKAFTLVELIIVITILAILATIAFVSFQNYTKSARDSNRLTTLTQVEKGLDIYSVQVGSLPTPENPTSFTGGTNSEIKQGTLTKTVLQTLGTTPIDPVSGKEYTYSVFGNGKYYQVGANLENNISDNISQQAYANTFKAVKLVGNYKYDPSLPSLIIGSGSNIFSPDTCFLVNGGTDTLENCLTKKSDLAGKNTDTSLVGYWDMETRTDDTLRLKDLSGNRNDGFFTGGLNYSSSLSGGLIGNGLALNPGSLSGQAIEIPYNEMLKPKHITMSAIFRGDGRYNLYPYIITNGIPGTLTGFTANGVILSVGVNKNLMRGLIHDGTSLKGPNNGTVALGKMHIATVTYNENQIKLYLDGVLIGTQPNNNPIFWKNEGVGVLIGRALYTAGNNKGDFQGIIDEVKIYNRALSDEEILQQARIAGF